MGEFEALADLAALLRGETVNVRDWRATVELANRAFVTPALANSMGSAPPEFRAFVEDVVRRNQARNERLRRQLSEVAAILAARNIGCTVLKGAALLAETPSAPLQRLISDLDLLVDPEATEAAVQALIEAGFTLLTRYDAEDSHVAAELCRDDDVGLVDLHRRPPGPRHIAAHPELALRVRPILLDGVALRAPAPEVQLLHLALHDQFHDGDYWSGALDLRHLRDAAVIAAGPRPVDWSLFEQPFLGRFGRRVVGRQLLAARELLGAPIPREATAGLGPALQQWRSRMQLRHPSTRLALTAAAFVLEAPWAADHYRREAAWRRGVERATPRREARQGRLARLRSAFAPAPAAKI